MLKARPDSRLDIERVSIEPLRTQHVAACEQIMRGLPAWFGIEEAIERYAAELRSLDGFVAEHNRDVIGFVGLKRYGLESVEINVVAVRPEWRRKGVGSLLLEHVEDSVRGSGVRFLHTKTVAPSRVNEAYAESREFWSASGFIALDEHLLWGAANPCLVLLKVVA